MPKLQVKTSELEEVIVDQPRVIVHRSSPNSGETHQDILDAAIQEFALFGFNGASTSSIAKRANTKQPLLNYHFGSKEKLWQAAVNFAFNELETTFETIRETAGDLEPLDLLKLTVRTFNRFCSRHPRNSNILRFELGSESSRREYLMDRILKPMYTHFNEIIDAAITKGQIKPLPAKYLTSILVGAITNYYSTSHIIDAIYTDEVNECADPSEHADCLLQVIFEGLEL